jgi:hypothetical protein
MAQEEKYEDLAAEFEADERKAREEFEKLPPEEQKQIRYEQQLLEDRWNEVPY